MNSRTIFSKKSLLLLTTGTFFAFFVFGFSDNLKGPTLPALLEDLHLNYSVGGTILLCAYLGFMAATLSIGLLADVLGQKAGLVLAGISLGFGVCGFSVFEHPILLMLSVTLLGFGLGALELGCNSLIVSLHHADKGRYLNLLSVMHGLGSMVAPLYAGWLLAANVSWRLVYQWALLPVGAVIISFVLLRFPERSSTDEESGGEKINFGHLSKTAFTPKMLWYYTAITLYVAFELGIASWLVEYLQKVRGHDVEQSTRTLSVYFGLIMLGRFIGSFFVEHFGYLKSILIAALLASACVGVGVFGPTQFVLLLPVSGLFCSIIFPTLTAAISDDHPQNTSSILGLLFTFAGLGGIVGPWLVGVASEMAGINCGFGMNLTFGLLTAVSAFFLLQFKVTPAVKK